MKHILVIGASRGIGLELVRQYREQGESVIGTARSEEGLRRLRELGAGAWRLDVMAADAASPSPLPLADQVFDTVVYNAGVFGPRSPGLQTPTQAEFNAVMHTNVLGAMRLLPQLQAALAPQARLAVISSQMGSIAGRSANSGWLYRASKAALNSVLKDLSLELGGRAICVALHPGWVQTDMGGAAATLTVAESVAGIRRTLERLTPVHNGGFFNQDGSAIPW